MWRNDVPLHIERDKNIYKIHKNRLTSIDFSDILDNCIKLYYGVNCAHFMWVRGFYPQNA